MIPGLKMDVLNKKIIIIIIKKKKKKSIKENTHCFDRILSFFSPFLLTMNNIWYEKNML